MEKTLKIQRLVTTSLRTFLAGAMLLIILIASNSGFAYERYKNDAEDDGSNCSACHGGFKDDTSTKGSIFPSGSKHTMHNGSSYMNTDCDLCHRSDDSRNPYLGSSNGTDNNAGLGCNGCHNAVGLRAHHTANGITSCNSVACHGEEDPAPVEGTLPPYYGTVDTKVNNACNLAMVSNTNENWTIGDLVGLDNDGDNLYDLADFDCGPPYRIVDLEVVGSDIHISWETVGGRMDMLQVTPSLMTNFNDVGTVITNSGVGFVTNSTVEAGGVTPSNRFYRIRNEP